MPPETPSGRSSGVEHDLAKVGVEGSNPFARSNFITDIKKLRDDRRGISRLRRDLNAQCKRD